MRKCIHAYTPTGGAAPPPYFNFSDVGDGETAELTVRDHAQMVQHENGAYYEPGHHSTIAVHRDELVKLARSILDWARAGHAPKSRQPKVDVAALVRPLPSMGFADGEVPQGPRRTDCGQVGYHPHGAFRSAGAAGCLGMEIVGDGPRPG